MNQLILKVIRKHAAEHVIHKTIVDIDISNLRDVLTTQELVEFEMLLNEKMPQMRFHIKENEVHEEIKT